MKFTLLVLLFALFGLTNSSIHGSCKKDIKISDFIVFEAYLRWENTTVDIRLVSTNRMFIRPQTRRPGTRIRAKGPFDQKKQFWTMFYRKPVAMFAKKSKKNGKYLFMGVKNGRVELMEGKAPSDLSWNFLNTDPRVFKYAASTTLIHRPFFLSHPATNSYVRMSRNGVIKLSCKSLKAVEVDLDMEWKVIWNDE